MSYSYAIYRFKRRQFYTTLSMSDLADIPGFPLTRLSDLTNLECELKRSEIKITQECNDTLEVLIKSVEFYREPDGVWILCQSVDEQRALENRFGNNAAD